MPQPSNLGGFSVGKPLVSDKKPIVPSNIRPMKVVKKKFVMDNKPDEN